MADFHQPTLYVGTNDGLLKSVDSGWTWGAMNSGLPETIDHQGGQLLQIGPQIGALVIDPLTPTTLYGSSRDIFKSTDGAASWAALKRGEWIENTEVTALVIDPTTPTTLYVALYMSGIFKSTDGGESWTAVNRGLPLYFEARVEATSLYVTDVVIDPTTPTTLYAQVSSNSGDGVYKSTDGGATWVSSHVGVSIWTARQDMEKYYRSVRWWVLSPRCGRETERGGSRTFHPLLYPLPSRERNKTGPARIQILVCLSYSTPSP